MPLITLLFTASLLLNYSAAGHELRHHPARHHHGHALLSAAHIAEIPRRPAALPRGQYEAADALGLDYWRSG
ncbi:MAG: hypothetical protein R3D84_10250 [Paracoccaceae bacterium]